MEKEQSELNHYADYLLKDFFDTLKEHESKYRKGEASKNPKARMGAAAIGSVVSLIPVVKETVKEATEQIGTSICTEMEREKIENIFTWLAPAKGNRKELNLTVSKAMAYICSSFKNQILNFTKITTNEINLARDIIYRIFDNISKHPDLELTAENIFISLINGKSVSPSHKAFSQTKGLKLSHNHKDYNTRQVIEDCHLFTVFAKGDTRFYKKKLLKNVNQENFRYVHPFELNDEFLKSFVEMDRPEFLQNEHRDWRLCDGSVQDFVESRKKRLIDKEKEQNASSTNLTVFQLEQTIVNTIQPMLNNITRNAANNSEAKQDLLLPEIKVEGPEEPLDKSIEKCTENNNDTYTNPIPPQNNRKNYPPNFFLRYKCKLLLLLSIAVLSGVISVVYYVYNSDTGKPEPGIETETATDIGGRIFDTEADLEFILNGVNLVEWTETASFLTIYGDNAFPILSGRYDSILRPSIGGGLYGKGRFAVYTHTTCWIGQNSSKYDNDKLLGNIALWTANMEGKEEGKNITAAICANDWSRKNFERVFSEYGIISHVLQCYTERHVQVAYYKQFDFVVVNEDGLTDRELEALTQYIKLGGGLILGTTPWSYGVPLEEYKETYYGNKFLFPMGGIACGPRHYAEGTLSNAFNASSMYLVDTHGGRVWNKWKTALRSGTVFPWNEIMQMQTILIDRLTLALVDNEFVTEIITEFEKLLTPKGKPKENLQFLEDNSILESWSLAKTALREGKVVQEDTLLRIKTDLKDKLTNKTIDEPFLKDVIYQLGNKVT